MQIPQSSADLRTKIATTVQRKVTFRRLATAKLETRNRLILDETKISESREGDSGTSETEFGMYHFGSPRDQPIRRRHINRLKTLAPS